MKFIQTITLVAGITLLVTACNQEPDKTDVTVKANTNPLLAYVPADTAYLFAPLEPAPEEITDAYIERFQPIQNIISMQVTKFQQDYASGNYEDNKMADLAMAVLDELGGTLNADSLEKLGMSLQAPRALYAMGIFPVLRVGLDDAQVLRDAIARIESKMDFTIPQQNLNGIAYWRVTKAGMPLGLYIAILDKQLVLSAFPVNAEAGLLAAFLGQETPSQSIASTNALAIMNQQKGYTRYGSGFLDLQKLGNEILNTDSATRAYFGPDSKFEFPALSQVCVSEIKSMIAKTPRMTAGSTKLTANEISMRYELEIENGLAASLAGLVSDVPAATDGDHLLSGSLAIKVGKLRNFMLERADAIVAAPYQCELLQKLNQEASKLVAQLDIPMPPMVNNLMGARILIDDLDTSTDIPTGTGLATIHIDKPEMLIGTASMLIPGFGNLDLANQSEPVRIPTDMLPIPGIEVFALMNDSAIGVAIGEQQAQGLSAFMAAEPQQSGVFFSAAYDQARQAKLQDQMSERWDIDSDKQPAARKLAEEVRKSYISMLGRSRVDMRFTEDGLVIDSRITFK